MTETALAKQELSQSERFTNMVIAEFGTGVGEIALAGNQKRLVQNYFMAADVALQAAEEKRLKKTGKYQDPLPVVWANVDMQALAQAVVSAARVGWDPLQSNHVSLIPFKNNTKGKYSMTMMPGYRGIEVRAVKYGLDVPDVIIELVYTNDKFKSAKRDKNNPYETYEFDIIDDFDRGEIKGGFYYHSYLDHPEKNKLVVMSLDDIKKRKPKYASPEFWGGEKDIWDNGKVVGKEKVDGWFEKMAWKTIYRAAYMDITIDSQKIDDDFVRLKQAENDFKEVEVQQEIDANANTQTLDIVVEAGPEIVVEQEDAPPVETQETIAGPGF